MHLSVNRNLQAFRGNLYFKPQNSSNYDKNATEQNINGIISEFDDKVAAKQKIVKEAGIYLDETYRQLNEIMPEFRRLRNQNENAYKEYDYACKDMKRAEQIRDNAVAALDLCNNSESIQNSVSKINYDVFVRPSDDHESLQFDLCDLDTENRVKKKGKKIGLNFSPETADYLLKYEIGMNRYPSEKEAKDPVTLMKKVIKNYFTGLKTRQTQPTKTE